ncbi:MAG: disulfide bond formation protein B [Acidiferrobacterales bacterium]
MTFLRILPARWLNLGAFLLCAALLGYAYYLEHYVDLEPCPLCIFQRVGMSALGIVFLIAGLHNAGRIGSRIYAVLIAITALVGASIAGRHVWLQHLPAGQVPDCGADLEYLFEILPLTEVLKIVFTRSGECAEVIWTFLGLSMPGWVLIWFVALGTLGLLKNWIGDRPAERL